MKRGRWIISRFVSSTDIGIVMNDVALTLYVSVSSISPMIP